MDFINIDFHIHSCLSPCGSLEMGPFNLINKLNQFNIKLASITDHNTIINFPSYFINGLKNQILFLPGIEVQTMEEVHLVIIFPTYIEAKIFYDSYLKDKINIIKANYEIFGDQPIIDENENIISEEENLLIQSLNISFNNICKILENEGYIYFPSHFFSDSFSVISQLGFLPSDLNIKLIEISNTKDIEKLREDYILNNKNINIITNSDAHYLNDIGRKYFKIKNKELSELFLNFNIEYNKYLINEKIDYFSIINSNIYFKFPQLRDNIIVIYNKIKEILYSDNNFFIQNVENIFSAI
ncbi:MAG: PHP domain-containing protein [Spirochaetes bacterium]|nr:PHP domain-containing protein [Spirochaetota bacterium]